MVLCGVATKDFKQDLNPCPLSACSSTDSVPRVERRADGSLLYVCSLLPIHTIHPNNPLEQGTVPMPIIVREFFKKLRAGIKSLIDRVKTMLRGTRQ